MNNIDINDSLIRKYTRYYVEVWSDWSDSWFKASEYEKNRIFDNGLKDAEKIARLYIENNKKCRIIKEEIKRTIIE